MQTRGLLVDIDGVLTVARKPVPGATTAFRRLREAAVPMVFLTNTTASTRSSVALMLNDAGFPVDVVEIVTAPIMTAAYLHRNYPGARCLVVGSGEVSADLGSVTVVDADEHPDVVVFGGAGPEFTYETLNLVFRLAVAGTPVVAMHRNLFWATQDGLQLDTGAFLTAIEHAAGIEAVVIGKPAQACFEAALDVLGVEPSMALMVGDDLDSDVLGAQAVGIAGVLVRTGKYRPEWTSRGDTTPDHIIGSFADVPDLLEIR
jgi:HAD superfamily hydrolase (TIGR01458 family)